MKSLKSIAGIMLFLAIITLTIAAAQEKPQTKQAETLNGIPFDKVVLITLQALENMFQAKERLLPNVHLDDYYLLILRTAKRLALQDTPSPAPAAEKKSPRKTSRKNRRTSEISGLVAQLRTWKVPVFFKQNGGSKKIDGH